MTDELKQHATMRKAWVVGSAATEAKAFPLEDGAEF